MASFRQQIKLDANNVKRSVGRLFSGASKPRGAPVAMAKEARRNKRAASMLVDMQAQNEHSNKMSARSRGGGGSRGPTVAEQVAARAAAKLKAKKAKGQARRKKYEAAGSMAKKMKLIFVD